MLSRLSQAGGVALAGTVALTAMFAKPALGQTIALTEATIDDLQTAMVAGTLDAQTLVQLYLDRIEAYENQGPAINALITVNPNAIAEAAALDQLRDEGQIQGPLHGIPIILKDNYDTADLPTTAGSAVLAEAFPLTDGFVVQRLRSAGAIILGKANMSEFALSYGRLGYSSMGGLTRNPYDVNYDVSGSSSGTAAAIAANFAILGTGTDTAGSIRGPSMVAGLVGIKPTLGLVSRSGIVPLTLSFDVAGPMARTVTDAAIGLGVMAAPDPEDPRTLMQDDAAIADYTQFLDETALTGAQVGLLRDFMGGNPEVDALTQAAIEQIEAMGATVVEVDVPETLQSPWAYMAPAVTHEFKSQIEAYLSTLPLGLPRSLAGLIQASIAPAIADSPTPINPARLDGMRQSLASQGLADTGLLYNLSNQIPMVRQQVEDMMAEAGVDALIYPTMSCPASPLYTLEEGDVEYTCLVGDPYEAGYLANISGFPDITVPMGLTEGGLPVGLSFMAEAYSEPRLLGYAYAYEQAVQLQISPSTTPPLAGEMIDLE
jgi:amidase